MPATLILDSARVQRVLKRVAFEIVERNAGLQNVVVFGIANRGVRVAEALCAILEEIAHQPVSARVLHTASFRDDREAGATTESEPSEIDITDRDVILVDDVLFTGRTVRAALDALLQFGRPRTIQLAVLVDRGHREYPIRPDYVGRDIETKHREHVTVRPDQGLAIYVEE